MKILGVSGNSTVGKDLFYKIAYNELKKKNIHTMRFALADRLKEDLYEFLKNNCNLNIFKNEDKYKARPVIVAYGNLKRDLSNGTHWTSILQKDIEEDFFNNHNNHNNDVAIITDIRFDQYEKDEVFWLKNIMNGKLIHISKYRLISYSYNNMKSFVEPANEHEALNEPKLKAKADYLLEWEHQNNISGDESNLIDNQYLIEEVNKILKVFGIIN